MTTPVISLSADGKAAATTLITACLTETFAEAALATATNGRKAAAAALLTSVGWLKADGSLSAKGVKADATRGSAFNLARVACESIATWSDPTPLSLPVPVVTFPLLSPGKPHTAAMEAGKAADTLLGNSDACNAATPEQLAEARYAARHAEVLRTLATVQRAISRALADAKPAKEPAKRNTAGNTAGNTPQDAPKDGAPSVAPEAIIAAVQAMGRREAPKGWDATSADRLGEAIKALAPAPEAKPKATPKAADPVAAILAMTDSDAHAALRAILAALRNRSGADAGSIAAAREYVMAHGTPVAAPKPRGKAASVVGQPATASTATLDALAKAAKS